MRRLLSQKQTINQLLVVGLGIAIIAGLAISSNLVHYSFTSDDVAQQALLHNLLQPGQHYLITNNDTYVLKLPIYLVVNALMSPGRLQLLVEACFFQAAMIALLLLWWRSCKLTTPARWLVFAWLVATGTFWMAQTINPNTHNVELAATLLFTLCTIAKVQTPPSEKRTASVYVLFGGLIEGLLIYDDPYLLFFVLLPLILAVLLYSQQQAKYWPSLVITVISGLGFAVYGLLQIVFKHFGLYVNGRALAALNVSKHTIAVRYVPTKFGEVLGSLLLFFEANINGEHLSVWRVVTVVLNSSVVCLALIGIYYIVKKRAFSLFNIWILCTIAVCLGYTTLAYFTVLDSYRYLIILVPLTALLVAMSLQQLAQTSKHYYYIALTLVCLSLISTIAQSAASIYGQRAVARPNLIDYQIINALNQNHVTKAYGNYWLANVTYYLSDYKDNVLPTLCLNGITLKDLFLVDIQRFQVQPALTAIISSPQFVAPGQSAYPIAASCTRQAAIKQFGEPEKVVLVNNTTKLLIYNHNPWQ